ncbi:MAG: molybdopterin converting factor subunit 1 [Gemmataceae bacterium]
MIVRVQLFARSRDLAGADAVTVELPAGATVAALRAALAAAYPRLSGLLARCAVAVDTEFARDEDSVQEGSEIALLPPVSGG